MSDPLPVKQKLGTSGTNQLQLLCAGALPSAFSPLLLLVFSLPSAFTLPSPLLPSPASPHSWNGSTQLHKEKGRKGQWPHTKGTHREEPSGSHSPPRRGSQSMRRWPLRSSVAAPAVCATIPHICIILATASLLCRECPGDSSPLSQEPETARTYTPPHGHPELTVSQLS